MDANEAPVGPAQAEPAGAFVVVAFVEPTRVGVPFSKRHWPLHVTLLRFDAPRVPALEAVGRAIAADDGPIPVVVGADADFGYRGRVRVSLVEPEPRLQAVHDRIVAEVSAVLEAGAGRIHSPQHTGRGFRPHISVQGERRVHSGDRLILDNFALVDMAPDGDTSVRVSVAAWGEGAERGVRGT
ncbi:2'-5' RNA ligase family protein [Sinomonas humi]|uniref:2'-5' RNA ligase family protein n=1 Tax=Sinomonas humi TaxID=1338436 RepID=UPI0006909D46|nr:2'-5' RNA ligase family protein [Sinomonas humi]